MNWIVILPLIIRGLSAIQPLTSGVDRNKVSDAGSALIPVIESIIGALAPVSQVKVGIATRAATSVFDPDPIKWIQQILNLAGNNLVVDGLLGGQTLGAADAFAATQLGIVPGGLASEMLQNALKMLAARQPAAQLAAE